MINYFKALKYEKKRTNIYTASQFKSLKTINITKRL